MDRDSCCLSAGLLAFAFCLSCASLGWAMSLAAAATTAAAMWLIWRANEIRSRDEKEDPSDSTCPTSPLTREIAIRRAKSFDRGDVAVVRSAPSSPRASKAQGELLPDKRESRTPRSGTCRTC